MFFLTLSITGYGPRAPVQLDLSCTVPPARAAEPNWNGPWGPPEFCVGDQNNKKVSK